jgi:hypothetical protein
MGGRKIAEGEQGPMPAISCRVRRRRSAQINEQTMQPGAPMSGKHRGAARRIPASNRQKHGRGQRKTSHGPHRRVCLRATEALDVHIWPLATNKLKLAHF